MDALCVAFALREMAPRLHPSPACMISSSARLALCSCVRKHPACCVPNGDCRWACWTRSGPSSALRHLPRASPSGSSDCWRLWPWAAWAGCCIRTRLMWISSRTRRSRRTSLCWIIWCAAQLAGGAAIIEGTDSKGTGASCCLSVMCLVWQSPHHPHACCAGHGWQAQELFSGQHERRCRSAAAASAPWHKQGFCKIAWCRNALHIPLNNASWS